MCVVTHILDDHSSIYNNNIWFMLTYENAHVLADDGFV